MVLRPEEMRQKRRPPRIAIALVLIAALLLAVYLFLKPRGQETYLVYGVDAYGSLEETGRSDAMMLVRLDHAHRRLYVVTFARDMLVDNGRGAKTKINTLIRKDQQDGPQLLCDAVERNFSVASQGWFRVNFSSLVSIVDALGGVTLTLSEEEARYVDKKAGFWPGYPIRAGECRLCGGQALWYARCREVDSDLGRIDRQTRLAEAMTAELRHMSIRKAVDLYQSMNHAWRASLSAGEQARLALRGLFARRYAVTRISVPFEGAFRYGRASDVSGILPDIEKNRALLLEALGETVSE